VVFLPFFSELLVEVLPLFAQLTAMVVALSLEQLTKDKNIVFYSLLVVVLNQVLSLK
jgi:hypothetical protein